MCETEFTIKQLRVGKPLGVDNIHPEYIKYQGRKATEWLIKFFSTCMRCLKLPKIWRHAKVIAILKPNKLSDDPKRYRPISLLCVPYKIMECLLHARLEPVVDPQLLKEQAGFHRGKSTADQVTLRCLDVEDSFQAGKKAGAVFLDLTAAYDTVWLCGLHTKLLEIVPD